MPLFETLMLASLGMASWSVWDGVLDRPTRTVLRTDLERGKLEGTFLLDRTNGPRTVVESVIYSILEELDDHSNFVEYWTRDRWVPIGMHRDIDEALSHCVADPKIAGAGLQRCPRHAHVLYVDTENQGPTCLWEELELQDETPMDDLSALRGGAPRTVTHLSIVPAVPARLLRFNGNILHSVPMPACEYVAKGSTEEDDGVVRTSQLDVERLVVLFNTWSEAPVPCSPLAAFEDDISDASVQAFNRRHKVRPRCQPLGLWKASHRTSVLEGNAGGCGTSFSVPLMGDDFLRRGCQAAAFSASSSLPLKEVERVLLSKEAVHRVAICNTNM